MRDLTFSATPVARGAAVSITASVTGADGLAIDGAEFSLDDGTTWTGMIPGAAGFVAASLPVSTPINTPDAIAISSTLGNRCLLLADGSVLCWGGNEYGQIGDGTTADRMGPVAVRCWGSNDWGAIGHGSSVVRRLTPVTVRGLTGATSIVAGRDHTCALVRGGSLRCWGSNLGDQLLDPAYEPASPDEPWLDHPNATAVPGVMGVTAVAAGADSTCAIFRGGTTRCWGVSAGEFLAEPTPVRGLIGTLATATHSVCAGAAEDPGSRILGRRDRGRSRPPDVHHPRRHRSRWLTGPLRACCARRTLTRSAVRPEALLKAHPPPVPAGWLPAITGVQA